jgi:uncharacterized protein with HEPN domain
VRRDLDWLLGILEAIEQTDRYAGRGRVAFETDELIRVWVVHHLEQIGEAAKRISEETRALDPSVPWAQIIGVRNILTHQYFAIDRDAVWSTVQRDWPERRRHFIARIRAMGPS